MAELGLLIIGLAGIYTLAAGVAYVMCLFTSGASLPGDREYFNGPQI